LDHVVIGELADVQSTIDASAFEVVVHRVPVHGVGANELSNGASCLVVGYKLVYFSLGEMDLLL
jgi:hypothetical protein